MIEKVRIHEIAKELGITSRDVMKKALEINIEVKSAQSVVTMEQAESLSDFIMNGVRSQNVFIPTKTKASNSTFMKQISLSDIEFKLPNLIYNKISKTISTVTGEKHIPLDIQKNSIEIEIENLKSISKLHWSIPYKKGIYVIIAENGSGKSSLVISLAKLVQPSVLTNEFIGKGFEHSKIIYKFNNQTYIWDKQSRWLQSNSNISMPKLEGFFESSVHTGTRFKKINKNIKDIEVNKKKYKDIITAADIFIQDNMNYILYGDTKNNKKFSHLYHINVVRKRQSNDGKRSSFTTSFFALFLNSTYIKEYFFSTGEYFLLSLLKFINTFRNKDNKEVKLIIIDEIELSLHPLAQKRLMEKIEEFCELYNILFIFATHSLQIIENILPDNIHYLKNNNGLCDLQSPIYPSYLSSKLYTHTSFDYVLLVEDNLAKIYVEKLIRKNINQFTFSYVILPIGGWAKLYEMYSLNYQSKIYGSAKIKIIFDGDVKTIKEANVNKYNSIPKLFLPFKNIENIVVEYLKNNDDNFEKFFNSYVYTQKMIELNLSILNSTTEEIKNTFKKFVKEFAKYSSTTDEVATERIIEQIIKQNKIDEIYIKFEKDLLKFFS